MATFLVTGGAGFIGSHLVQALIARGDRVWVVDDFNSSYSPAIKRRNLEEVSRVGQVEVVEGDIRDPALWKRVFRQATFEAVVHLAALAGVRPSIMRAAEYVSVNLGGTTTLLEAMVAAGIPRLVFASSSSVYGNNPKVPFHEDDRVDQPLSPYAATKRGGELLAHTFHHLHSLQTTCLRFFTAYGPRQRPEMAIHRFATLMRASEPIPRFGDGTSVRDYTYIDDIIDGVVRALDRPVGFRIYNLGESRTTSLRRLVELLEEALGLSAKVEAQPDQPGDVRGTCADIGRAREELGYCPQVPVEEGIPLFVRWFREHSL